MIQGRNANIQKDIYPMLPDIPDVAKTYYVGNYTKRKRKRKRNFISNLS